MLLRVVDLETTGFAPPPAGTAAVCEVAAVDLIDFEGRWELGEIDGVLCDPGHPIPPETSAIHHIIDADVVGRSAFADNFKAMCLPNFPDEDTPRAFVAHNAKFERQFITDEMTGGIDWICTYKCALRLYPDAPAHSNQALRYYINPVGLDRDIANVAHRAGPDAYVTALLLREMLKLASIEEMIEWSKKPALQVKCHIGSWRGRKWEEVDEGFMSWILTKDFDEDVVFTVRHHLDLRAAQRKQAAEARA